MTSKEKYQAIFKRLEKAAQEAGQFRFSRQFYQEQEPLGCRIAFQSKNKRKNKKNFWGFPFDHNLITSIPSYINASPMEFGRHRYIAAQGPRRGTFSEFWHMIWAEEANVIVSVTNEKERMGNRIRMKFDRFWPHAGSQRYGIFNAKLIDTRLAEQWEDGRKERILQRKIELSYLNETREIMHLHMENWLDDKIIHHESLVALAALVDNFKQHGTIVVHCAAGVGRTGTFIAFHSLYHEMLEQLERELSIEVDVAKRVQQMRSLRWGAVVGHSKQYDLLIEALRFAFEKQIAIRG